MKQFMFRKSDVPLQSWLPMVCPKSCMPGWQPIQVLWLYYYPLKKIHAWSFCISLSMLRINQTTCDPSSIPCFCGNVTRGLEKSPQVNCTNATHGPFLPSDHWTSLGPCSLEGFPICLRIFLLSTGSLWGAWEICTLTVNALTWLPTLQTMGLPQVISAVYL